MCMGETDGQMEMQCLLKGSHTECRALNECCNLTIKYNEIVRLLKGQFQKCINTLLGIFTMTLNAIHFNKREKLLYPGEYDGQEHTQSLVLAACNQIPSASASSE